MRVPAVRDGETVVIGLARSGSAVSRLLHREGRRVYASDAAATDGVQHAAAELRALGVEAEAGRHDLERIAHAALAVVSPGVPPDAPPLVRARAAGVPVVSEVEIALGALTHTRIVAVTGTNGKSTVTALIAHVLRALGVDAVAAGNIGTALSEIALRPTPPDVAVVELSSFQLHDTPSLNPIVGVLTNLAPDHLDRYASVGDYYGDKALLWRHAHEGSTWVSNADDAEVQRRLSGVAGRQSRFSLVDRAADAGPVRDEGGAAGGAADLWQVMGRARFSTLDVPLAGRHNVANALAAVLAVAAVTPAIPSAHATPSALAKPTAPAGHAEFEARLRAGLRSFAGLPHRLQTVAERDGVLWIDDSKATNVSSALVAINAMTRPSIVLLGGLHKGEPYTALAPALLQHARRVIAYGSAADTIAADLAGVVPLTRLGSSFEEVMAHARAAATPGDAVLLSPACSSFDMFSNYEDRGARFTALAREP